MAIRRSMYKSFKVANIIDNDLHSPGPTHSVNPPTLIGGDLLKNDSLILECLGKFISYVGENVKNI